MHANRCTEALGEVDIRVAALRSVLASFVLLFLMALPIGPALFVGIQALRPQQRDCEPARVNSPLTQACQAYFVKNQEWPRDLKALLVRDQYGQIYLEDAKNLIDPWGSEYRYDAKGPRNQGLKPDIWTVAPDGTILGNWSSNLPPRSVP